MPHFVRATIESIVYGRGEKIIQNNPVNLSLCKSISKAKFAWYPDNRGKPSIRFWGCNEEWVYDKENDRDRDFDRIAETGHGLIGEDGCGNS